MAKDCKNMRKLAFTGEAIVELERLQASLGLATEREVYQHSFRWTQYTQEEVIAKGGRVLAEYPNGETFEVVPPWVNR